MPRRVLVVDDELLVAGFMFDVLEGLGHHAREAYSGQEALEVLREDDSFDLVITDLNMPAMNGYELIDQIKEARPDLQIALVTANVLAATGDDTTMRVLPKPYSREELRCLMRELETADAPVRH